MGAIQYLFLIRPLYLISVCSLVRIKEKHHMETCLKDIGLHLQILLTTPHSIVEHHWEELCIQLRMQQNMHF